MSDSKTPTPFAKGDHRAPRVDTGAIKPTAAVPKYAHKIGGRHAAITNNLNTWSSYKNWTSKIRGLWEENK
jgi:hypothetical protein